MKKSRQQASIASIPKNQREGVRISLENYSGHNLVSQHIWFQTDAFKMRPSEKGLVLQARRLPEFIRALQKAQNDPETLGRLEQ